MAYDVPPEVPPPLPAVEEAADEGFAEFYAQYFPRVRHFAVREFGRVDGEDIAQEAMLRAYRLFDRLDRGHDLTRWLFTVTRNVGIDVMRVRARAVPVEVDAFVDVPAALRELPAEVLVRRDNLRLLRLAVERLGGRDWAVLRMAEFEGLSVGEMAEQLDTTPNAVRQQLFRARRHLAREFRAVAGRNLVPAAVPAATSDVVDRVRVAVYRLAEVVVRAPYRAQDVFAAAAVGATVALAPLSVSATPRDIVPVAAPPVHTTPVSVQVHLPLSPVPARLPAVDKTVTLATRTVEDAVEDIVAGLGDPLGYPLQHDTERRVSRYVRVGAESLYDVQLQVQDVGSVPCDEVCDVLDDTSAPVGSGPAGPDPGKR